MQAPSALPSSVSRHSQQQRHVGAGSAGGALRAPLLAPSVRPRPPRHANAQHVCAIHIDRRQHLELAWRRQQEREELLKQGATFGRVTEVQDLEHLEKLVEQVGSSLLVVFYYTRSCGVCKELLRDFTELCEEAKKQQVRAVFARHNLLNEFDNWSDISVWHKIRIVPTLVFYDEGAVVKRLTLHDVRRMGEAAPTIRAAMQQDLARMREIFRQTIFEKAPGARS